MQLISKESIIAAHKKIANYVHRTPILSSTTIANMAGCSSFSLKC